MYSDYKKVRAFIDDAKLLDNTSKSMKDIYELAIVRNSKKVCAQYFSAKHKIVSYKYKDFAKNVQIAANAVHNLLKGQDKGRVVVLKLANGPHWGEVFYAILMAGYKPLLNDARSLKDGTLNLAIQSKAVAIISDDVYEYDITKISSEQLFEAKKPNPSFVPTWENEVIFCSSGTTGDVKLMVYTGQNLSSQIQAALKIPELTGDLMYPGEIKNLAMVPLHHIFGFVAVFLWFTYYGKTLIYPASIASKDLLEICQKCGATHVFSVPLLWDGLMQNVSRQMDLKEPEYKEMLDHVIAYNTGDSQEPLSAKEKIFIHILKKKLVGTKVRFAISGGGYINEKTVKFINGLGYPLHNGYGMTEVGVVAVDQSMDVAGRLEGTIGKPLNGVEFKILPSDPAVPNVGELLIKSPITHSRTIIGGVEGPAKVDKDGYFHSGDIVCENKDSSISIKGRIKDIIINSDGENIFPDELEFCYKKVANITNLCVLGIKKAQSTNEEIVLVLEIDNSIKEDEFETLKTEVVSISNNLPKGVKIKDVYLAKAKLPLANGMKVKRFVLKKAIEEGSPDYVLLNAKREEKSFDGYDQALVKETRDTVRKLFSEVLYLPLFKIEDGAHWINDLGGDSMNYVELLQKVEETCDVKIPEEKYGLLANVNDFVGEILTLKTGK